MNAVEQKLSVGWKLRNLISAYKQFRKVLAAVNQHRWDIIFQVCTVTTGISICVRYLIHYVATNINAGSHKF